MSFRLTTCVCYTILTDTAYYVTADYVTPEAVDRYKVDRYTLISRHTRYIDREAHTLHRNLTLIARPDAR